MEPDLERRWQEAVRQKNLDSKQLTAMVKEMEKAVNIPHHWNERMKATLARERVEVGERYSVKIGQTTVSCGKCGKPSGFGGHICQDIRLKMLSEAKKAISSTQEAPEIDVTLSQSDLDGIIASRPFYDASGGV